MSKGHALVIGGSKGTGRAIVTMMAQSGYRVSVISRHEPQEKIQKVHYGQADITDPVCFGEVFHKILKVRGKLNHLIFCQQYRGGDDDWSGQIETSLTAVKQVIGSAIDNFEKSQGKNAIVFITSLASHLVAVEQPVGYHVAKAGMEQMMRYYAVALGPRSIRVNAVSPGNIFKEENKAFYLKNKKIYDLYKEVSPLGRMVTSEDVAEAVEFLCSRRAACITGQSLIIDAGVTLQIHTSLARALKSLDRIPVTQGGKK